MRIMAALIAEDQKLVLAFAQGKFFALDTGERLEGRTRGPSAIGTVAVGRVKERIRDAIPDGAAFAPARERRLVGAFSRG